MKTLNDYLSNAIHYVFPDVSVGGVERQREKFYSTCQKFGLDRKFSELVENNKEWQELAEKKQVYFFVDVPKPRYGVKIIPDIRLIATEMGTVPVIKLVIDEY